MKRFYKLISREAVPGGYEIHLDGKPIKTPSGKALVSPREDLADIIIQEWAAQGENIIPDSMPVTQILITALDRVAAERAAMEKAVLSYLDTDLLCYRATLPAGVAQRQAALWDPWLAWFSERFGQGLAVTDTLAALRHPPAVHRAVAGAVAAMDDLEFTVFQLACSLGGSIVLALAFVDGAIAPENFHRAVRAEEDFKAEIYKEDFHGLAPHEEKKYKSTRRDLDAAWFVARSLSS